MSGIGGVFHADGSPADRALLERMREIIDHRGPDGAGFWMDGNVGLVHRLLRNTEESVSDQQPMTNGRGLWITADCRIDNREELRQSFVSSGLWRAAERLFNGGPVPDSAYILLAYELWREEAPSRLLGDFSFAVWDQPRQTLFCARDPVGIKPFNYHWNGRIFLFGSEMKQVFQDPGLSRDLDLYYLSDLIAMNFPNREQTPYEAVRRLPPAHRLEIRKGNFNVKRYWHWDPDSEPLSKSSCEENAGVFLSLFTQAVQARLRTFPGCRTGSLLSGGLDSSSIVSIAATLAKDSGSPFPVFSLSCPEAGSDDRFGSQDSADEFPYRQALIERYRLESHEIEIRGRGPFDDIEKDLWHQEIPLFSPGFSSHEPLCHAVRGAGVRVLLDGNGGDELFFVRSRPSRNGLRGRALAAYFVPQKAKVFYRRHIREILPGPIRRDWANTMGLRKRALKDFSGESCSSSFGISVWLKRGYPATLLETVDRGTACAQFEIRFPFLDLRLLRLSASLPAEQKVQGGIKKFLLRQALQDYLPLSIQGRLKKSRYTPAVRTNLERYAQGPIQDLFKRPHPLLLEMVDLEKLRKTYVSGDWFSWHVLSLDQWLKNREDFLANPKEDLHEMEAGCSAGAG